MKLGNRDERTLNIVIFMILNTQLQSCWSICWGYILSWLLKLWSQIYLFNLFNLKASKIKRGFLDSMFDLLIINHACNIHYIMDLMASTCLLWCIKSSWQFTGQKCLLQHSVTSYSLFSTFKLCQYHFQHTADLPHVFPVLMASKGALNVFFPLVGDCEFLKTPYLACYQPINCCG